MAGMNTVVRIPFFIGVTVVAGFIVYTYQRMMPPEKVFSRAALGLIWGGAVGNFVDRLLYGKVIDFIDTRYHQYQWYVFNVADSCITIGLILLLLEHFFAKSGQEKA
jgi:signal peptidase II